MIIDAWAQHPTLRHVQDPMFDVAAAAGRRPRCRPRNCPSRRPSPRWMRRVSRDLICAWVGPRGGDDLERRGGRLRRPGTRPARRRRLRRHREADGGGARDPALRRGTRLQGDPRAALAVGAAADRPPLLSGLRRLLRTGRSVLHADRPHRAADAVRARAARSTSTRSRSTSPNSRSSPGTSAIPWTDETIAVATKHENVYIDTSAYTVRRYPAPLLVDYMRARERQGAVRHQLSDDHAGQGAGGPRRARTRRGKRKTVVPGRQCAACIRHRADLNTRAVGLTGHWCWAEVLSRRSNDCSQCQPGTSASGRKLTFNRWRFRRRRTRNRRAPPGVIG